MWIVIATSGMAVWLLVALVAGLLLGAVMRRRDTCDVPVPAADPASAEEAVRASR